jgi:predicted RNA-binding Zn ribbon-like protein
VLPVFDPFDSNAMGDVSSMEQVGGHRALDFVNTLGGSKTAADDEYLHEYADLLAWSQVAGLIAGPGATKLVAQRDRIRRAEVLRAAQELREHLDAVLRARLADRAPRSRDLDGVRDAYVAALRHAHLEPGAIGYAWTWPSLPGGAAPLELPLWAIAHQAIDLLQTPALERISECANCRWLFLDLSRNHSRRWCSMNTCGATMKMRRYRAKRHS